MEITYTLNELKEVAKKIVAAAKEKTVLFYGVMGSGKTTLIKEIVKELGVESNISSPTFSLVNEYITNTNEIIYHFDFYRIKNEEEILDQGFEDYFYQNKWCLVEWPKNVENLLPLESTEVSIQIIDEHTRKIIIAQ